MPKIINVNCEFKGCKCKAIALIFGRYVCKDHYRISKFETKIYDPSLFLEKT